MLPGDRTVPGGPCPHPARWSRSECWVQAQVSRGESGSGSCSLGTGTDAGTQRGWGGGVDKVWRRRSGREFKT